MPTFHQRQLRRPTKSSCSFLIHPYRGRDHQRNTSAASANAPMDTLPNAAVVGPAPAPVQEMPYAFCAMVEPAVEGLAAPGVMGVYDALPRPLIPVCNDIPDIIRPPEDPESERHSGRPARQWHSESQACL